MKRLALVAALALALAGCVVSDRPVGERAVALSAAEWDGLWRFASENETYRIEVTDAHAGRARVTLLRPSDTPQPDDIYDVTVMSGGGGMFVNVPCLDAICPFRLERNGDRLTVRMPSPKALESAGIGRAIRLADGEAVLQLDLLTPEALRRLASPEGLALYLPDAMVLQRMP